MRRYREDVFSQIASPTVLPKTVGRAFAIPKSRFSPVLPSRWNTNITRSEPSWRRSASRNDKIRDRITFQAISKLVKCVVLAQGAPCAPSPINEPHRVSHESLQSCRIGKMQAAPPEQDRITISRGQWQGKTFSSCVQVAQVLIGNG